MVKSGVMFRKRDVERRGERVPGYRVSAVFKADGRYVLREICEEGMRLSGITGGESVYGFPGEDLFTGDENAPPQYAAAVRAANSYGFDVEPRMPLSTTVGFDGKGNRRVAAYVLCDLIGVDDGVILSDVMEYANGVRIVHLRLMTAAEILAKGSPVKKSHKAIIRLAELKQSVLE